MPPYFLFSGGSTTAFFTDKEHQQNIKKFQNQIMNLEEFHFYSQWFWIYNRFIKYFPML
mgnify:FL=1